MKITNAIVWDHRGRVPEGGKGQLEVRVTIERRSYYFGTGIRVHKSEFVAGRIVNCAGADALNDRLAIIYNKVLALVNACVRDGQVVNTDEIRKQVWQVVESQSDEPTFIAWIEKQLPLLGVSDGTEKHYKPLVSRLTEFGQMKRWQDVTVENVCNFDAWLRTLTKPMSDARRKAGAKPERLSDGGIYNYHKCLRAILNRAMSFGKIENNPYNRLKGKIKRGDKPLPDYLTDDEMALFDKLILPKGSPLDVARDLFTFQMFTGLSYTDMQAFNGSEYKFDGEVWKNVGERIKTGVPYVSQLLPPVVKVLEKYGWEIPHMNNADYNRQLKALQTMMGIKTRLHSHLARHTFATWMLRHGVSIEHVSKMLGHANITQTQRYAKVQPQAIFEDFDKMAKMMNGGTEIENKKLENK